MEKKSSEKDRREINLVIFFAGTALFAAAYFILFNRPRSTEFTLLIADDDFTAFLFPWFHGIFSGEFMLFMAGLALVMFALMGITALVERCYLVGMYMFSIYSILALRLSYDPPFKILMYYLVDDLMRLVYLFGGGLLIGGMSGLGLVLLYRYANQD